MDVPNLDDVPDVAESQECAREDKRILDRLAEATPGLTEAVQTLARRTRIARILGVVNIVLVVLLTGALIGLGFLYLQILHTQDQATKVRERVLCPLYTLFIIAESEPHPAPTDPRLARAQQVIHDGYSLLDCANVPLQPPPH